MKIQISQHALARAEERGASEEEVAAVLNEAVLQTAKGGRFMKAKTFPFDGWRNGIYYEEKLVEVIFNIEGGFYIVITVVVKYGKFRTT